MNRMATALALGLLMGAGLMLQWQRPTMGQPAKDPNKGWMDYPADKLKETERLKQRPGDIQVLAAISEFYEGIYRIRPDFSQCAYPLQTGEQVANSLADVEKGL